jgi:hypothetical protein
MRWLRPYYLIELCIFMQTVTIVIYLKITQYVCTYSEYPCQNIMWLFYYVLLIRIISYKFYTYCALHWFVTKIFFCDTLKYFFVTQQNVFCHTQKYILLHIFFCQKTKYILLHYNIFLWHTEIFFVTQQNIFCYTPNYFMSHTKIYFVTLKYFCYKAKYFLWHTTKHHLSHTKIYFVTLKYFCYKTKYFFVTQQNIICHTQKYILSHTEFFLWHNKLFLSAIQYSSIC